MLLWASVSLSPLPVKILLGSNSTHQLWLHAQEAQSWPRAVHPGSRRAEINKTSPNLQSPAFNQGRKVTCWNPRASAATASLTWKGLLLKDTYVDAEEWKTREVKLIYCFNLLHCRLNKLKDSCFPSEARVGRGGRFRLPGWKEKCRSGGQQEQGILERMRPGMNWWWLHTLAHLESKGMTALCFIFYLSLKISPLGALWQQKGSLCIQCHAGLWPHFLGEGRSLE